MNKKSCRTVVIMLLTALMLLPQSAFAYNAMRDHYAGIPSLSSPLFYPDSQASVGSSWNEPRTGINDSPHKGVDQSVFKVNVGPMSGLGGTAEVIKTGDSGDCGGGIYQVIKYNNNGTIFYSLYFHLEKILISSGNVYLSDYTAISGASGTFNCSGGAAYHLHFEVLGQYREGQSDHLTSRVSVSPANYVNISISDRFTVFKNYSFSGSNPNRTISIDAINYNLGNAEPLQYVKIYYKPIGSSTWSSADMTPSSSNPGRFTYNLNVGSSGAVYDILIVGRRTTNEYWITFPALKTTELGKTSTPNVSGYSDWIVQTAY